MHGPDNPSWSTCSAACPVRSMRWMPAIGLALLLHGLLAGVMTLHSVLAQDPATANQPADLAEGQPQAPAPLHRIVVPGPMDDTAAAIVIRSIETLPAPADGAGPQRILLDFNQTASSVRAAAKLASFIFTDTTHHYTAAVSGRVSDATLMPITACHDIWMWPGAQLGPFDHSDPDWEREFATFRSWLRSADDARQDRAGLWEKWLDPKLPLYVTDGPRGPVFVTDAATHPRARQVQGSGPLVLVGADAARNGLATVISGDSLRGWAESLGFDLREATLRPDASEITEAPKKRAGATRPPLPTTPQQGVVIPITDTIDDGLLEHIRLQSAKAIENGATVIVFEMDTPGGLVSSMGKIVKAIDEMRDKVLTVAWVKSDAISAGAMIALSCDYLAMRDGTRIGDCQPILMSGDGYKVAGEKIQTYLRTMITNLAERNGYPQALVQAMITQELEVIRIRPKHPTDIVLLQEQFDSEYVLRRDFDEWEHKDRFQVVEVVVHGSEVTASDAATSEGQDTTGGELLTLTDRQARHFGFALPDVHTWDDLQAALHIGPNHGTGPVERFEISWGVQLMRWISALSGIFIMAGLLGIYMEVKTPGFGLGGLIAIISFGIYFTAGMWIGIAEAWEILVFLAGILLILAEIFVIPGFGIAGISGLVLTVVGLLLIGQEFVLPSTAAQGDVLVRNVGGLVLSLIGAGVGIYFIAKLLPGTPILNRLLLAAPDADAAGLHGSAAAIETGSLIGAVGITTSVCRPSGKARFGDRVLVVQSRGQYLEPDTEVVVVESAANRIVVKPLRAAENSPAPATT